MLASGSPRDRRPHTALWLGLGLLLGVVLGGAGGLLRAPRRPGPTSLPGGRR